jgi:N-acyl-D-amino-acid deacylase
MLSKIVIGCLLLCTIIQCTTKSNQSDLSIPSGDYDILIQNGLLSDGTGSNPYFADLLIRGDSIAHIGKINQDLVSYSEVIDATGKIVSPGFIDTHAHGDPLSSTSFENFVRMGVTTILLGQDGSHPSIYNGTDISLAEWMNQVDKTELQLNIAMLAGHATLRKNAGILYTDQPSEEQLQMMVNDLRSALNSGCYGISTGLEYVGGMSAKQRELESLAEIVGAYDGIMMSHVRNEDDDQIEKSINELLSLGSFCKVHVSHMKVVYGIGKNRAQEILGMLVSAKNKGILVSADVYPYIASYTTIGILFPEWAKTNDQFELAKEDRLDELKDYLVNRVNKRNGPSATLLAGNEYARKTLETASSELNVPFVEVLLQIGPDGGSGAYFIMEDSLMSTFILHPGSMISSDGSPTMRHPRGYGTFARIIERYVIERNQLTIEEAIRKMTSLPANTIGIDKRGIIKVGNYADLLVFDPNKVEERATYLDPYQTAKGFDQVIINGNLVLNEDSLINTNAGQLLKKTLVTSF